MAESLIAITEGSGANVSTQSMTINSQTVEIERSMMGIGVVTLPGSADITAEDTPGTYPVSAIDLQGRYYIILKSTFDADDSTVSFRFLFFDSADAVIGYSELLSIDNSGESDGGGRYYGIPIVFANVFCAKNFQIKLIDITGDVTIYAGVC